MQPKINETFEQWMVRWLASVEAKAYLSQFKREAKGKAIWLTANRETSATPTPITKVMPSQAKSTVHARPVPGKESFT